MIDELLLKAHQAELSARSREFEQRMTWTQIARIEALQGALRRARARLRFGATTTTAFGVD